VFLWVTKACVGGVGCSASRTQVLCWLGWVAQCMHVLSLHPLHPTNCGGLIHCPTPPPPPPVTQPWVLHGDLHPSEVPGYSCTPAHYHCDCLQRSCRPHGLLLVSSIQVGSALHVGFQRSLFLRHVARVPPTPFPCSFSSSRAIANQRNLSIQ
jgi:hypothetical protein